MGYEIVIEEEFELDDDDEEDVQKRGALRPMNRCPTIIGTGPENYSFHKILC